MFERLMAVLDVLLLLWIVVQGQFVWYYERELFRMNRERFEERRQWRTQKRLQQMKKEKSAVVTEVNIGETLTPDTLPPPTKKDTAQNE